MKDTVAIIGSYKPKESKFDWTRTDCDIWVFNETISNKTFARADLVFQMHLPVIWRNPANRNDPRHYEWLQSQTECAVIMQDVYPDVPRSEKYPIEEAITLTGSDHFLSSSIAYSITLAVLRGYKQIDIYGVMMASNTEWHYQREGVAFWLGFARGRGIKVNFDNETFRCPLYGYEGEVAIPYERFGERIEELKPDIEALSKEYHAGTVNIEQALKAFIQDADKDNETRLIETIKKQCNLGEVLGVLDGARQENERYQKRADIMREAAQDYIFSRQEFETAAARHSKTNQNAVTDWIVYGTRLELAQQQIANSPRGSNKRQKAGELFRETLQNYLMANNKAAIYKGAGQESYRYMEWLDKHIKAAGGAKSEAVMLEAARSVNV